MLSKLSYLLIPPLVHAAKEINKTPQTEWSEVVNYAFEKGLFEAYIDPSVLHSPKSFGLEVNGNNIRALIDAFLHNATKIRLFPRIENACITHVFAMAHDPKFVGFVMDIAENLLEDEEGARYVRQVCIQRKVGGVNLEEGIRIAEHEKEEALAQVESARKETERVKEELEAALHRVDEVEKLMFKEAQESFKDMEKDSSELAATNSRLRIENERLTSELESQEQILRKKDEEFHQIHERMEQEFSETAEKLKQEKAKTESLEREGSAREAENSELRELAEQQKARLLEQETKNAELVAELIKTQGEMSQLSEQNDFIQKANKKATSDLARAEEMLEKEKEKNLALERSSGEGASKKEEYEQRIRELEQEVENLKIEKKCEEIQFEEEVPDAEIAAMEEEFKKQCEKMRASYEQWKTVASEAFEEELEEQKKTIGILQEQLSAVRFFWGHFQKENEDALVRKQLAIDQSVSNVIYWMGCCSSQRITTAELEGRMKSEADKAAEWRRIAEEKMIEPQPIQVDESDRQRAEELAAQLEQQTRKTADAQGDLEELREQNLVVLDEHEKMSRRVREVEEQLKEKEGLIEIRSQALSQAQEAAERAENELRERTAENARNSETEISEAKARAESLSAAHRSAVEELEEANERVKQLEEELQRLSSRKDSDSSSDSSEEEEMSQNDALLKELAVLRMKVMDVNRLQAELNYWKKVSSK